MNPILMPTHNGLQLVKRAVHSFNIQDIATEVHVIDNFSTDGTLEWVAENTYEYTQYFENAGVSKAWNDGLNYLFRRGAEYVLVCNSDVDLPEKFYSTLLGMGLPFVTGISVGTEHENIIPKYIELTKSPDFSAFLIRKECWEHVGHFDNRMVHYASDIDFHIRAHRKGITLNGSNIPFYHERSSTIRLAEPYERQLINRQADLDREAFRSIYGYKPGEGHERLFE